MEDGVWRTVGGRRIFIKDGEDLASAMKKSGKFKSAKKKNAKDIMNMDPNKFQKEAELEKKVAVEKEKFKEEKENNYSKMSDEELKKEIGNDVKKLQDEAHKRGMLPSELQDQLGIKDSDLGLKDEYTEKFEREMQGMQRELKTEEAKKSGYSKMSDQELKEKYMNIPEEERVKAYEEGKNWKDLVKEKEHSVTSLSGEKEKDNTGREVSKDEYDRFRKAYMNDRISKEDYRNDNYAALRNVEKQDIEKASGLKVEKAFETDAFGTGKEDRFQLSDGRYIAHSTESMGQKEDSWSINKVEGGNIKNQEFKSYDDMIKHLSGDKSGSDNSSKILVEKDTGSAFSTPGKKYELLEESKSAYGDKIYKVKDEKGDISWQKASKFEEKSNSNNNAYKSAYNDYKKKHPNSKLTLNQFIDMSEGK